MPTAAPVRIVVLDGHTLNPGDLDWSALSRLGDLAVHARTAPADVASRARGAALLLTNQTPLGASEIGALPDLKYIGVLATGTNVVDLAAARQRGVVVSNVPSYGATSVAEHTLALMLDAARHLSLHLAAVQAGAWSRCPDFSLTLEPLRSLSGRVLGIVGHGAIGKRVAELGRALGMQVLIARHGAHGDDTSRCDLDELFERADFVTLHCPLTATTEGLVNAQRLSRMKPDATLINTARGGLVDEPALADALRRGRPGRAYLDVLGVEPPPADHPLLGLPVCHVTPHVAWASLEARRLLMQIAVANAAAFLAGKPQNVVR
jgi:glycerate dehydrogenase